MKVLIFGEILWDIIEGKKLFQRGKEKKDDFRYAFDMYT